MGHWLIRGAQFRGIYNFIFFLMHKSAVHKYAAKLYIIMYNISYQGII